MFVKKSCIRTFSIAKIIIKCFQHDSGINSKLSVNFFKNLDFFFRNFGSNKKFPEKITKKSTIFTKTYLHSPS